jgi:hypothetical protein
MSMADKKEPKVVDVRVKEYDGFINTHKATVTTDKGVSRTGYGTSESGAINHASDKAKRASR